MTPECPCGADKRDDLHTTWCGRIVRLEAKLDDVIIKHGRLRQYVLEMEAAIRRAMGGGA